MTGRPSVVLLVEDNPAHARLATRCLASTSPELHIKHVSDGEMLLDYLWRRGSYGDAAQSPRPDLILLDLRLPKLDGLQALRELKTHPDLHRIPVVVLSSSNAPLDVLAAYELNVNSYLVKPIDFEQWLALLRLVSSYWLRWNVTPS